jgi:hypothetical protein
MEELSGDKTGELEWADMVAGWHKRFTNSSTLKTQPISVTVNCYELP